MVAVPHDQTLGDSDTKPKHMLQAPSRPLLQVHAGKQAQYLHNIINRVVSARQYQAAVTLTCRLLGRISPDDLVAGQVSSRLDLAVAKAARAF